MWTVKRIDEADFGCEERLPGEPLMVLVTIENTDGRECQFECADNWLISQDIREGDEWPEDIEEIDADKQRLNNMSDWMDNYYDAVDEMEEGNSSENDL